MGGLFAKGYERLEAAINGAGEVAEWLRPRGSVSARLYARLGRLHRLDAISSGSGERQLCGRPPRADAKWLLTRLSGSGGRNLDKLSPLLGCSNGMASRPVNSNESVRTPYRFIGFDPFHG